MADGFERWATGEAHRLSRIWRYWRKLATSRPNTGRSGEDKLVDWASEVVIIGLLPDLSSVSTVEVGQSPLMTRGSEALDERQLSSGD